VSNEVVERIAKPEADPRVAALESRIAALDATLAPLGDRIGRVGARCPRRCCGRRRRR